MLLLLLGVGCFLLHFCPNAVARFNAVKKFNSVKPEWQEWASFPWSWFKRKKLSDIHLYGFVINDLHYVEMYFLYAHFSESIYHEWMLDFVNAFSTFVVTILCFSSFFECGVSRGLICGFLTIFASLEECYVIVIYDTHYILLNSVC